MKKIVNKVLRRSDGGDKSRITNETVAEHREKVLAGGRKFKYPLQYAKHKLVINAVIISIVSLFLLMFIVWWQLYKAQNTSDFMYRITRVVPVSVASVDGQAVPYSDYLMKYRSAAHYLENKEQISLNSDEGRLQLSLIKVKAVDDAVADAYGLKLANQLGISVSDEDLESFLKLQRQSSDGEVSEQTYNSVIRDYYNWAPDEYRHATKNKLLRQKVAYAIDEDAKKMVDRLNSRLKASSDLQAVAKKAGNTGKADASFGASGWVPKTNQDGGLSTVALRLKVGQVSSAVESNSGDGYYFVKLVGKNDTQVRYEYIKVSLTKFARDLQALIDNGDIDYYIEIDRKDE